MQNKLNLIFFAREYEYFHTSVFKKEKYPEIMRRIIPFILCLCLTLIHVRAQCSGAAIMVGDRVFTIGDDDAPECEMNSVMKFPQAIYVAHWLDSCGTSLDAKVTVRKDSLDPDTWSPMLAMIDTEREFSYGQLLALSLQESDNNACDLLFMLCGGPNVVQGYMRSLDLEGINIRWTEKQMHINPNRSRDNRCTPADMVKLLDRFYHDKDTSATLSYIWHLMLNCHTGDKRIMAALPQGARLAHKTGTGWSRDNTLRGINDVGVIVMPNGEAYPIAIFLDRCLSEDEVAQVARQLISDSLTGN